MRDIDFINTALRLGDRAIPLKGSIIRVTWRSDIEETVTVHAGHDGYLCIEPRGRPANWCYFGHTTYKILQLPDNCKSFDMWVRVSSVDNADN